VDISLVDAYELTNTDWTQLNPKQREYLDKIFGMVVKICILIDEPISLLTHELREIANDIKGDPIFNSSVDEGEGEEVFSEYIPGNISGD
jgi:hypothetical protein